MLLTGTHSKQYGENLYPDSDPDFHDFTNYVKTIVKISSKSVGTFFRRNTSKQMYIVQIDLLVLEERLGGMWHFHVRYWMQVRWSDIHSMGSQYDI